MEKELENAVIRIVVRLLIISLLIAALNLIVFKSNILNVLITKAVIFLTSLWIIIPLISTAKHLYPDASASFKLKAWRLVVNIRRYYKLTAINNFLLHVGAVGIFFVAIIQFVFNTNINFLSYVVAAVLSLSFILDMYHRIRYILSKVWKGILGKIILALFAALALVITNFASRQWVVYTTGLDAKYYGEFINSSSIFFTPFSYLFLASLFFLVIIFPEIVGAMIMMFLNPIKEGVSKKRFKNLSKISVRMRTGKRLEHLSPKELSLLNTKTLWYRIVSAPFFLLTLSYFITQADNLSGDMIDKAGRLWLVNYYYHAGNNKTSTMRYYKVDESQTSVAVLIDGKWQFFTLEI